MTFITIDGKSFPLVPVPGDGKIPVYRLDEENMKLFLEALRRSDQCVFTEKDRKITIDSCFEKPEPGR